jgi:hypothetical protein
MDCGPRGSRMLSGFTGNISIYTYPLEVEATVMKANKMTKYTDTVGPK